MDDYVVNLDDYAHRIGRTGRARKTGLATAFFNNNLSMPSPLAELMQEANQKVSAWLTRYASRAPVSGGGHFGGRDYRRVGSFSSGPSLDYYGGVYSSSGYGVPGGYGGGYGPVQIASVVEILFPPYKYVEVALQL
ncbi:hypothetical protein Ddye_014826 [Dipteronia dyeriana]|uniref:Uncharacterized protein n=1 Tax=Dipteronia dyeriana TaxID=168575 RepID=A0AAD9U450_9ROSI|nr:hypothetical protein Ddye_014826 [Dipteronia dyeriana]